MTHISQIPRLAKIPHILNKKREADKERKEKKEDQESPAFSLKGDQLPEKPKVARIKKPHQNVRPQSANKSVGQNIDLSA